MHSYYWFIFSTGQYKICTFSDKMTEYAGLVHIVWGQYALTNAWLGHNISGDNTTHLAIIQTIMQFIGYVTYHMFYLQSHLSKPFARHMFKGSFPYSYRSAIHNISRICLTNCPCNEIQEKSQSWYRQQYYY